MCAADFACISLSELRSGNEAASSTLFKACKDRGFFLLDLQDDSQGEDFLNHAGRVFKVGETLFDLLDEEDEARDGWVQKRLRASQLF